VSGIASAAARLGRQLRSMRTCSAQYLVLGAQCRPSTARSGPIQAFRRAREYCGSARRVPIEAQPGSLRGRRSGMRTELRRRLRGRSPGFAILGALKRREAKERPFQMFLPSGTRQVVALCIVLLASPLPHAPRAR